MASKIDLSGLNNFRQKLQNYANMNSFADRLVNAILEKGRDIALEEYAGVSGVKIYTEKVGFNGKIIAEGEQVAYIEFGTGEYAKNTYEGTLPTQGVPLTGSWTYYYDSRYKRTAKVDFDDKDAGKSQQSNKYYGKKGWFTTKLEKNSIHRAGPPKIGSNAYYGKSRFTIGQRAGNQMYRVSKRLREALPSIIEQCRSGK